MSTTADVSAATAAAAAAAAAAPVQPPSDNDQTPMCAHHGPADDPKRPPTSFLNSPPDSNNAVKLEDSESELSDLDEEPILSDAPMLAPADDAAPEHANEEEDIGEVLPDHWSGTVPVFRPTMHQFKDFKRFMEAVDSYGMKSGIIKIIPPQEWKDALPQLDDLVKQVKVREPIKQDIMGSSGTYRQVNILHGRSYNVPQWRQLCDQSEHQPPARRGERRANAEKPKPTRSRPAAPKSADSSTPRKRGKGRPPKGKAQGKVQLGGDPREDGTGEDRPMTPVSPKQDGAEPTMKPMETIEKNDKDPGEAIQHDDDVPTIRRMGAVKPAKNKTQSTSARRKYSRREGSAAIDEAAFKDWDYRMDISEYTPERCEELERTYWKTLTYAQPLYGADLMGTLFDESTEIWNLNKLPNLLDVLGTKVPGVNTAYLYLGMWKATFAWHLEDVDLYSINFLHFGAPKQWYSISQADARRFEAAMKNIWPADAKACDQFLRHKAFLISPQHLKQHYGITVNKCVSYPGEFVVTYPYGYHSGYNLGYNCAEAVNFALDSWLDMGKIAKKCECAQAQDSVWVDVYEIERKLRGEETEYEETEDEEDDDELSGLPTPPGSHGVRFQDESLKRKRGRGENGKVKVKKIKLRLKAKAEPLCCLCPIEAPGFELLPTDDGRKAHRTCALYLPETYIDEVDGQEVVSNVNGIDEQRLALKCLFCRSKRGACFQCSQKKCARAYHATCAAAAGMFIEEQDVPVFGEDGTEYKEQAFEFSCRFHRTKRDKKLDGDALETDRRILSAAAGLKAGDICQLQYQGGDIFAAFVVENRPDEQTLLLDVLPHSTRIEVEWKWLLLPEPGDHRLPKASAKAIPMPASKKAKDRLNAKRAEGDKPRKDDVFAEGYTWADFQLCDTKGAQLKVDLSKVDQLWHYLGKSSTDAKAQYTEDVSNPRHNVKSNFLETIPKPPKPVPARKTQFSHQQQPIGATMQQPMALHRPVPYPGMGALTPTSASARPEKPYVYKPRKPVEATVGAANSFTIQKFVPSPLQYAQPGRPAHAQYAYPPAAGYQYAGTPPMQNFTGNTLQKLTPPSNNQMTPQHAVAQPGQTQWQMAPTQHQNSRPAAPPTPGLQPTQGKAQIRTAWNVHSSIFQKYEFFQVHHNRDSTKYRTPYSPWGGFINGYEGNLRAHLANNQRELMQRASLGPSRSPNQASSSVSQQFQPRAQAMSIQQQQQQQPRPRPPIAHTYNSPYTHQPLQRTPTQPPSTPGTANQLSQQKPPAPVATNQPGRQKPIATKQQHLPAIPQHPGTGQMPTPGNTQKAAPVAKVYKIPPKESPVPLPAGFLAAMTAGSKAPATTSKAFPKQQLSGNNGSSVHSNAGSPKSSGANVSQTPIPIPRVPGITQTSNQVQAMMPTSEQNTGGKGPDVAPVTNQATGTTAQTPQIDSRSQQGDQKQPGPSPAMSSAQAPAAQGQLGQAEAMDLSESKPAEEPQGFPDVPGSGSMQFVERLMQNLRQVSQRDGKE